MSESLVGFRGVTLGRGGPPLVRNLTASMAAGEVWAVTGGPGSGKSTVLQAALGLVPPLVGGVRLLGRDLEGLPEAALLRLRAEVAHVPQGTAFLGNVRLYDNLALPLRWRGDLGEEEIRERIDRACGEVGLAVPDRGLPAHVDERTRRLLALARALALGARVLLHDAATLALEEADLERVRAALRARAAAGALAVAGTTSLEFALGVADRVLLLDGEGAYALGTPDEYRAAEDPPLREMLRKTERALGRRDAR